jgi:hypothetical protein
MSVPSRNGHGEGAPTWLLQAVTVPFWFFGGYHRTLGRDETRPCSLWTAPSLLRTVLLFSPPSPPSPPPHFHVGTNNCLQGVFSAVDLQLYPDADCLKLSELFFKSPQ